MTENLERGRTRIAGFADEEMEFQLLRQMGSARYGGAAIGECLTLARHIESGVPASWVEAFAAAAARQQADADLRAGRGHAVSARDLYLVASNSWRAAEYYTSVTNPRHREYGSASRTCFVIAMQLTQEFACDEVRVVFGALTLPAFYLRPAAAKGAGKTLMIISGYDGTLEETFIAYGRAALERGYRVLLFAGPGQMDTMREYPQLSFIPEYEQVGTEALEQVLMLPHTDPQRVALMGVSFGGYFATRIAVHEPRLAALIANSPIVDLHAYMVSFVGFDPAQMPDADDFRIEDIDHIPDDEASPQTRAMMRNLILRFGEKSFKRSYQRLHEFRIDDERLARLACPALGLVGTGEGHEPLRQYRHFLAVTPHATGHIFGDEEGADGHCQSGNLALSAAVALDWLDEALD